MLLKYTTKLASAVWQREYDPGCTGNDVCRGYLSVPKKVECDAKPPDDGEFKRLCNCIDSGKRDIFHTNNIFRAILNIVYHS